MADREHPKTHVEDQDLKKPRTQPLSPRHEGIDPLTESDKMYPREETAKREEVSTDDSAKKTQKTVEDQKVADKKADKKAEEAQATETKTS